MKDEKYNLKQYLSLQENIHPRMRISHIHTVVDMYVLVYLNFTS